MKLFSCACQGLDHPSHLLSGQPNRIDTSKRGFLTGLSTLAGAAAGVGSAGSLLFAGMNSAHAQGAAKPHRIDIHHHVVPPARRCRQGPRGCCRTQMEPTSLD